MEQGESVVLSVGVQGKCRESLVQETGKHSEVKQGITVVMCPRDHATN